MSRLSVARIAIVLSVALAASSDAHADPPSTDRSASSSAAPEAFHYSTHPPRGFIAGRREANGMVDLGAYGERSPEAEEIAWYASPRFQADVVVSTLDASRFAPQRSDPSAWGRAVVASSMTGLVSMDRTDPSTVTDAPVDREEPAAGLTVSIARRYANRSGDTDLYVHSVERDGILYRVALRV